VGGILRRGGHDLAGIQAAVVPDLESHVTAEELRGLLRTVGSLHASYGRSPNPFHHPIPEELVQTLAAAIMDVYSWQVRGGGWRGAGV
jgi:hypothetical protein